MQAIFSNECNECDVVCQNIDDATAARLEAELSKTPDDLLLHAQLIGYCSRKHHYQALFKHVFWLIRHHPSSPLAHEFYCLIHPKDNQKAWEKGKQLWLQQVAKHPNTPAVLWNAAHYLFCGSTYTYTSEVDRLLSRIIALEPDHIESIERLGSIYTRKMIASTHNNRVKWAEAALEKYLRLEERDSQGKYKQTAAHIIPCLAYEAHRDDLAASYAQQLLQAEPTAGIFPISLHYGHFVLGRLALRQENIEAARHHLIAMGEVSPSVYFSLCGPCMVLARDLHERAEDEVVLRYLSLCERLSNCERLSHLEALPEWIGWLPKLSERITMIEKREDPDFADVDLELYIHLGFLIFFF